MAGAISDVFVWLRLVLGQLSLTRAPSRTLDQESTMTETLTGRRLRARYEVSDRGLGPAGRPDRGQVSPLPIEYWLAERFGALVRTSSGAWPTSVSSRSIGRAPDSPAGVSIRGCWAASRFSGATFGRLLGSLPSPWTTTISRSSEWPARQDFLVHYRSTKRSPSRRTSSASGASDSTGSN